MSTRSRSRNHPYQRSQRSVRRSGRQRQRQASNMASGGDQGGCIDLTGNDSLDSMGEVIDLTNQSIIDSDPVVVISSADVDNADTFTRERPARRRHRIVLRYEDDEESNYEDNDAVAARDEPPPSSSNASASGMRGRNSTINLDDLSDEELPDVPFSVPDRNAASSVTSPVKATCPVCLETDSQIRRNRQLYSTVCGHIFCSTCIKTAIDTQHSCPTCRKRLTKRQIHQLFL